MDLRQLAALTAVADSGTFSAAAERLHTVQSNVSAHIARLESELGVTLVDRAVGRLTEEGEVVVARARRIHCELEALTADVNALRHEVVGEVRIGIIGTIARWLVPSLHQRMSDAHPGVRLVVVDASTTSLAPQLLAGTLSLAVVNLPVNDPEVSVEELFTEEMIAVIPDWHPLHARESLTVADLDRVPVILPPLGTAYRAELDRSAQSAGITLVPKAEIDGVRLLASLAYDGVGVAIVPATAIEVSDGAHWRALPIEGMARRHVGIVLRRRAMLPAPSRALLAVLREILPAEVANRRGITLTESA